MTDIEQLLDSLRRRGITLWAEGERLGYKGPEEALTTNLLARLKARKADILSYLRQSEADSDIVANAIPCRPSVELWPSLAEFYVYDDLAYLAMATHETRNQRYLAAFRRYLPGKTVVEVGPGPELILTRLALQAGATKIYAIELLEQSHLKARQTLRSLGLEDRIILIHGDATRVNLPERVDYCISEIVGSIGGAEGAAKIINSTRRFLKNPDAVIPQRSLTQIAAITLPDTDYEYAFPDTAAHYLERIFDQVGAPFDLRICLKYLPRERLISSADALEDLDYTREVPLEHEHTITLTFERDALCHGLLAWLVLYPDQDQPPLDILESSESWLPVYFPMFPEGVRVSQEDRLQATVHRRLCSNGVNPDYVIEGRILRRGEADIPFSYSAFHLEQRYRHNLFYARLFAKDTTIRLGKNHD